MNLLLDQVLAMSSAFSLLNEKFKSRVIEKGDVFLHGSQCANEYEPRVS